LAGNTLLMAITGAGGAGVMTAAQMLLDAAANAGFYGLMARSSGPQIRGGEVAAFLRFSTAPVDCLDDRYQLFVALDWLNVERFAAEITLDADSVILCDVDAGDPPACFVASGARIVSLPLQQTVKGLPGGRLNMIGLGLLAELMGLANDSVTAVVAKALAKRGAEALDAGLAGVAAGRALIDGADIGVGVGEDVGALAPAVNTAPAERWNISGNEAAGLGSVRGGVRFVAAYPITPATEILEWLTPSLGKVGGVLVQAEDELASINMVIGASFGGTPSLTATSGPGLALMTEALGLAVASETPLVVINVMRGGPSTGIPTKSEQSDLNIALYGLHGDAPHIVTAARSIADCLFTAQWSVHLAERLQVPVIMLSDQSLGQSRAIIDRPADMAFIGQRQLAEPGAVDYRRYAITASGVSAMAIPGTPGGAYVADGLEHAISGRPSSAAEDHEEQLAKRERKLAQFDYGQHWADIEGDGPFCVLTFGSSAGPAREACARAAESGLATRLIVLRLLAPVQEQRFAQAIDGVERMLVVEQSHSRQFYRYLRAHYDLPRDVSVLGKPGPLPIRPGDVLKRLQAWS
jgi:2-oxoglutarate/2-oxoacid ferredoxin oxidoreductase subunit alpha